MSFSSRFRQRVSQRNVQLIRRQLNSTVQLKTRHKEDEVTAETDLKK